VKKAGIIALVVAVGVAIYLLYFAPPVKQLYALSDLPPSFTIDLETQERNYVLSTGGSIKSPAVALNDSIARSGKFSQKLTPASRFGMGIEISKVGFLDQLVATAWIHEDSKGGVLAFISEHRLYKGCVETGRTDGPWKEVRSIFKLDREVLNQKVTVYCWLPYDQEGPAWIDDLTVEVVDDATHVWPEFEEVDMALSISDSDRDQLQRFRDTALDRGVLLPQEKRWFEADVNGFKAKVKLKGDWTDHLQGPKWSFRVKCNKQEEMPLYSIQSPGTRNMLAEWVVHKAYEQEGVLTTDYSFVKVNFNSEFDGIYAKEEHFGLNFTKSRHLPDGPILKFDEDPMWSHRGKHGNRGVNHPYSYAAAIESYDNDYWVENDKQQRDMAMSRLFLHQHDLAPADSLIDLEIMAKYLAIAELFQATHSYIWHNQRFYHNPETERLEPIAYDNCPIIDTLRLRATPTACHLYQRNLVRKATFNLHKSDVFVEYYKHYISMYSSEKWQNDFWASIDEDLNEAQDLLRIEFPGYRFDKTMVLQRAEAARRALEDFDVKQLTTDIRSFVIRGFTPQNIESPPIAEMSCQCYTPNTDGILMDRPTWYSFLHCINYYHHPIVVPSFGELGNTIAAWDTSEPLFTGLSLPTSSTDEKTFSRLGEDIEYSIRIHDYWPFAAFPEAQRACIELSLNSE